ncbi:hypothetical protein BLAT2472_40439 [Burkholderia latens]
MPVVTSVSVWLWRIRFRSYSGLMSNSVSTWSSISRCCAVTQTLASTSLRAFSARTSGAILMASGRVPNTSKIFFIVILVELLCAGRPGTWRQAWLRATRTAPACDRTGRCGPRDMLRCGGAGAPFLSARSVPRNRRTTAVPLTLIRHVMSVPRYVGRNVFVISFALPYGGATDRDPDSDTAIFKPAARAAGSASSVTHDSFRNVSQLLRTPYRPHAA